VDHARAGSATRDASHLEERHQGARVAAVIAVGDVPHVGVIGVNALPHKTQPQQLTIEIDVRIDVSGDRRAVV
jgi:hypothetical protein